MEKYSDLVTKSATGVSILKPSSPAHLHQLVPSTGDYDGVTAIGREAHAGDPFRMAFILWKRNHNRHNGKCYGVQYNLMMQNEKGNKLIHKLPSWTVNGSSLLFF